ncbi:MAG: hypothetical protein WBZ42_07725 [Halobacteriota archaeon]
MKTLQESIKNFNRRWKIPYDDKTEFERFRNRVLLSFEEHLGYNLSNYELGTQYSRLVGLPSTSSYKGSTRYQAEALKRAPMAALAMAVGNKPAPILFHDTEIWEYISRVDNLPELMRCVRCVFWLKHYVVPDDEEDFDDFVDPFFRSICNDIDASHVPVNVNRSTDILFYPKGAKILDQKLVDDVLEWLPEYPRKIGHNFESALSEYQNKRYKRSINEMRLSLEIFLKHLVKNSKSLEKQTSDLGKHLKEKNVPTDIRNTYSTILVLYSKYQNEYAKHDDHRKPREISEEEAEFIIYETGLLMRFLIQLDLRQTVNS